MKIKLWTWEREFDNENAKMGGLMSRRFFVGLLLLFPVCMWAQSGVTKPLEITFHVTSVNKGIPIVCGDTPDCTVTEITVEGYADAEKTSTRIRYMLTCDQVMATKEPPHLAISCGSIHANNEYRGRIFDSAISFWPVEKHTPPPQWGLYSIVSEKEISR
jgi:hypothetical protein